jgi:hypothetical protein
MPASAACLMKSLSDFYGFELRDERFVGGVLFSDPASAVGAAVISGEGFFDG